MTEKKGRAEAVAEVTALAENMAAAAIVHLAVKSEPRASILATYMAAVVIARELRRVIVAEEAGSEAFLARLDAVASEATLPLVDRVEREEG